MRLLFVTSGLERGGAEGFLVRLVPRLAARGHTCRVAVLAARAPLAEPLGAAGVETVPLGGGAAASTLRLARLARRFRPDVIQGWMYRGNLAASAAAFLSGGRARAVWSVRQGLNDLAASPWTTRLSVAVGAALSGGPAAIVYNADSAMRQHVAFGFSGARARVIPNGIDLPGAAAGPARRAAARARFGLEDAAFVVALVARWHPVKNHRGFVRAAGILARRRPEARFLLAGAGVDEDNAALVSWLQKERIADRAILLGEVPDVAEVLAAADTAALASHGEALPNAILEAMASGLPCVATDVGDLAALIGDTGVVVRADDAAALAAGWARVAAMPAAERRSLGEQARARVAGRYALDTAVAAFEALYLEAMGVGSV